MRDAAALRTPVLQLSNVTKHYLVVGGAGSAARQGGVLRAVDGVSIEIGPAQTYALVGESGSGKTTTGKIILGIERPTTGDVIVDGMNLWDKGVLQRFRRDGRMSVVFQDPSNSLNPRMKVESIVAEPLLTRRGTHTSEVRTRVSGALSEVQLEAQHARRYPHQFSGGQRQRIAIARALIADPGLVVLDEPVSGLDVSVRAEVMNVLKDLQVSRQVSYLLISHNLATVRFLSHRVGVMYLGRLVEEGPSDVLFTRSAHPYTVALVAASMRSGRREIVLAGEPPSPVSTPAGCRFSSRCWLRAALGNPENCQEVEPPLRNVGTDHQTACHWSEELTPERIDAAASVQD